MVTFIYHFGEITNASIISLNDLSMMNNLWYNIWSYVWWCHILVVFQTSMHNHHRNRSHTRHHIHINGSTKPFLQYDKICTMFTSKIYDEDQVFALCVLWLRNWKLVYFSTIRELKHVLRWLNLCFVGTGDTVRTIFYLISCCYNVQHIIQQCMLCECILFALD